MVKRLDSHVVLGMMALAVLVSAAPAARADGQADRFPEVRASLVEEGRFQLAENGDPKNQDIDLDLVYRMGLKRPVGTRREKMNLYVTSGSVSVPYPPQAVFELLTAFDGYRDWALTDVNNLKLHPNKAKSWNFELMGIESLRGRPGMSLDVKVFKFGRGSIGLKEQERVDSAGGPALIHLVLADRNLFVKHFTFSFFIYPLEGGRGSAIRFENEVGLRAALDWFFRGREDNPAETTKPRVAQFLRNVVAELDRRAAAPPPHPKTPAPEAPAPKAPAPAERTEAPAAPF